MTTTKWTNLYENVDDCKRFKVAELTFDEGKRWIIHRKHLSREYKIFVPTYYENDIFLKFQGFKKDELAITDNIIEFVRLTMSCSLEESIEHQIERF